MDVNVCSKTENWYYLRMFAQLRHVQSLRAAVRTTNMRSMLVRCFSVIENKLAFIDIIGKEDDEDELDRNGLKLPPIGSIVSYTTQRNYHVGVYCGRKVIDGLQKLQIRNEHDCIRDVHKLRMDKI